MSILRRCKFCGWIPPHNSYEKLVNHIMIFHEEDFEKANTYANQKEKFEEWQEKHIAGRNVRR